MHYTPDNIPDNAVDSISPAFDRFGLHDAGEWVQRCRDDLAQLWKVGNCWAITEIFESKRGRVCHIVALAGDFTMDIMSEIESWAKDNGCVLVHFTGRKGWERRLPDYAQIATSMEKVIT